MEPDQRHHGCGVWRQVWWTAESTCFGLMRLDKRSSRISSLDGRTWLQALWGWGGFMRECGGAHQSHFGSGVPYSGSEAPPFVCHLFTLPRTKGQWTTRSTALPEWVGAPLSTAPWTQHTSQGLWLRAQRATSGPKAQRKPLHLSNKKKCCAQSERAASCWHHTSVIRGEWEHEEGALQPFRGGGGGPAC